MWNRDFGQLILPDRSLPPGVPQLGTVIYMTRRVFIAALSNRRNWRQPACSSRGDCLAPRCYGNHLYIYDMGTIVHFSCGMPCSPKADARDPWVPYIPMWKAPSGSEKSKCRQIQDNLVCVTTTKMHRPISAGMCLCI